MIDDEIYAQVLHEEADKNEEEVGHVTVYSHGLRKRANEVDPKLEIHDGTLCIAKHTHRNGEEVCGYHGEWGLYDAPSLSTLIWNRNCLYDIQPVQYIKPNQIAIDIPDPNEWPKNAWCVLIREHYQGVPNDYPDIIFRRIGKNEAFHMWR